MFLQMWFLLGGPAFFCNLSSVYAVLPNSLVAARLSYGLTTRLGAVIAFHMLYGSAIAFLRCTAQQLPPSAPGAKRPCGHFGPYSYRCALRRFWCFPCLLHGSALAFDIARLSYSLSTLHGSVIAFPCCTAQL